MTWRIEVLKIRRSKSLKRCGSDDRQEGSFLEDSHVCFGLERKEKKRKGRKLVACCAIFIVECRTLLTQHDPLTLGAQTHFLLQEQGLHCGRDSISSFSIIHKAQYKYSITKSDGLGVQPGQRSAAGSRHLHRKDTILTTLCWSNRITM